MKVDKSNPKHWLYLALFGLNTLIAIILRPFTKSRRKQAPTRQIILYGHRLSGNLLALHRHITKNHSDEFRLTFLTMDPAYYKQLCNEGISACLATHPAAIRLLATTDAVISDHGLHSMTPLLWFTDAKFFDVWHGIPFKGFDEKDFKTQHCYTEIWVASPLMAELYETKYGFSPEKIYVTGYARTDRLVIPEETNYQIRKHFGLKHDSDKNIVLFAPTWKQDAKDRTLFPFGISPEAFFETISHVCQEHNATPVMRSHINAQIPEQTAAKDVEFLPFSQYPDTEALLQITDILICDWSSIAFDYLLLNRPAIFLDTSPPFAKGLSLGKEYRYGQIATSFSELLSTLVSMLEKISYDERDETEKRRLLAEMVYGGYADGRSAERNMERLSKNLVSSESSQ